MHHVCGEYIHVCMYVCLCSYVCMCRACSCVHHALACIGFCFFRACLHILHAMQRDFESLLQQ